MYFTWLKEIETYRHAFKLILGVFAHARAMLLHIHLQFIAITFFLDAVAMASSMLFDWYYFTGYATRSSICIVDLWHLFVLNIREKKILERKSLKFGEKFEKDWKMVGEWLKNGWRMTGKRLETVQKFLKKFIKTIIRHSLPSRIPPIAKCSIRLVGMRPAMSSSIHHIGSLSYKPVQQQLLDLCPHCYRWASMGQWSALVYK